MSDPRMSFPERWGDAARSWCLLFGALAGPTMGLLDDVGIIDRKHGGWLVVSIVLSAGFTVAGIIWAADAYRRHSLRRDTSETS